jgi:Arc/MetJ-type ribon-helix-helix transcriptional regulator
MVVLLKWPHGDKKVSDGNKRERITIRLTKRYLDLLNLLIERGVYNSRNEAIRDALRIMYEYHGLNVSPQKKAGLEPKEQDAVGKN